jgi:outer membrane receptor protein involved in Fe transport
VTGPGQWKSYLQKRISIIIQTLPTVTGFMYRDGSKDSDSYIGYDRIAAAYAGLKIPVKDLIEVYGGIRIESFDRKITGHYDPLLLGDTSDILIDTINIFPSLNIKIKLGQKYNLRFSYGKTVNRPEFRENAPIIYEDFDEIAIIMGNPDLKSAYILNYDARIEWYPNIGEIISLAAFYKDFSNPIEMFQIPAGTVGILCHSIQKKR